MLAAFALAGTLALALPAVAANEPSELDVYDFQANVGKAAEVELDLFVAAAAAPTAKATIYVPAGFGVNTSAAPGTQVGEVFATLLSGSASTKGTGKVVVDDPANYLAQTCAPGAHAAVWVLKISAGGQEVDIPVYVDPAGPDVSRMASYTLQACFTAPTAGSLRLGELDVDLTSGITNPSATASHLWRALVTPFGADGTPSLGGTTELQAAVPLPQRLTLAARYDATRHVVVLSGTVKAAGRARSGVKVHFLSSPKPTFASVKSFGTAKVDKVGHFTLTHKLTATTYFVAYMNQYYAAGCQAVIGPAPCTTATVGPPPPAVARAVVKH